VNFTPPGIAGILAFDETEEKNAVSMMSMIHAQEWRTPSGWPVD
jgi:hypothetical protein